MQVPLELTFRGIEKSDALVQLVEEQAQRLHRFCNYITSIRVALEHPQEGLRQGSEWRVRVEVHVPPGHHLVAHTEPADEPIHTELRKVVKDTFHAVERQVKDLTARQNSHDVKRRKRRPDSSTAAEAAKGD